MPMLPEVLSWYADGRVCLFSNNEETQPLPDGGGLCTFAEELWTQFCGFGITCLDQGGWLPRR